MSARSIVRSHRRNARRRARRAGAGAVATLGAAAVLAPGAEAASFQVSNLADSGPGSLREAIAQANATGEADTVTFAAGLTGTIRLSTGEIPITSGVDIQGPGAELLSVSGEDDSRIFSIDTDEAVGSARDAVSIAGLTLTNGYGSLEGGAIAADETSLTLTALTIRNSRTNSGGGAVNVDSAPLTIVDSELTGNSSDGRGGAVYTDGDSDPDPGDTVTIRNCRITENYASDNGGAIYVDDGTGGDFLLVGSEVSDNDSLDRSGALHFYGHAGFSTIRQSSISGNRSGNVGGGIYFDSSSLASYSASGLLVENTTISGNRSEAAGGGAFIKNSGDRPVSFVSSTVADNASDGVGGGIHRADHDVSVTNTIVADNRNAGGEQHDLGEGELATDRFILGHTLVERDSSLLSFAEAPGGSNLLGVDPLLGDLASTNSTTQVQLPAAASPVVDAGTAADLTQDQRGLPRTYDQTAVANRAGSDATDMGSVELPDAELLGADASAKRKQKQKGRKIKVRFSAGAGETVDIEAAGAIKAGKKSYPLKPDEAEDVPAGATDKGTLKPKSKKASKKIAKLLASGKKAKAKIEVGFADASGNAASETLKVTLVGKKPKK